MDRQKECNHNNGKIILRSRSSQQANVKGSFFSGSTHNDCIIEREIEEEKT